MDWHWRVCRRRAAKLQCIDRGCLQQAGTREPLHMYNEKKSIYDPRDESRAVCDKPNMCASLIPPRQFISEVTRLSDSSAQFLGFGLVAEYPSGKPGQ